MTDKCPCCGFTLVATPTVEALRAEVARLREALAPFAAVGEWMACNDLVHQGSCSIKMSDFEHARAALREQGPDCWQEIRPEAMADPPMGHESAICDSCCHLDLTCTDGRKGQPACAVYLPGPAPKPGEGDA